MTASTLYEIRTLDEDSGAVLDREYATRAQLIEENDLEPDEVRDLDAGRLVFGGGAAPLVEIVALPVPSDARALDHIAALLDGRDWSPDDLDSIAALVRATGRTIRDAPPELMSCPALSLDECRMIRERSVAGLSDTIPACPIHEEA